MQTSPPVSPTVIRAAAPATAPARPTPVDGALLAALVAASAVLRTRLMASWFWVDEGLSVGIASHRFTEIPGLLRQDGSPPLYYLLLHGWMSVVGRSETATHVLSLLFALAIIPVALWAGWSLFGRRAGWFAAILAASNPFLTFYGQETRMYTLAALFSLVAITCFLHAFVLGHRRLLAPFTVSLALLLYTHNWGLFLTLGLLGATAVCFITASDRRRVAVDAALAYAGLGLLYLPWLPTLRSQAAHTGAPWSSVPHLSGALADLTHLVGDKRGAAILLVAAGAGLVAVVRSRDASPRRRLLLVAAVAVGCCLTVGFVASQASPAWTLRYLAVVIMPLIVLAAFGMSRLGKLGIVALVIVVALSPQAVDRIAGTKQTQRGFKSNVKKVLADLSLRRGDLLVSIQPEEVPVLHYYAPAGVRLATPTGLSPDPQILDWRDVLDRLRASRARRDLAPLVGRLPMGSRLALIVPVRDVIKSDLPWFNLMRQRARSFRRALVADPRLRLEATIPSGGKDPVGTSVRATVFRKLPPPVNG